MTRLISTIVAFFLMVPAVALRAAEVVTPEPSPPQAVSPKVMVFPFNSVGQAGENGWIGSGIEQSLQADLAKAGAQQVTAPTTQPGNAEANPMILAARAGASVAVVGGFQVVNGEVRATGAVLDTDTGQPVGVLAATGPVKDLFKVEDSLGVQLHQALTQIAAAATAEAATQPTAGAYPPSTAYEPPPSYESSSTTYNYYYTPPADNYYPYYYPTYSYWPTFGGAFFWFSPIVVIRPHHHFDHGHGRFFDHRGGFHNGFNGFDHRNGFSGGRRFGNDGSRNFGTFHHGTFDGSTHATPQFHRSPGVFEGGPSMTPRPSFRQFRSSPGMNRSFNPAGSGQRFAPAPSAPGPSAPPAGRPGGVGGRGGFGGGGSPGGAHGGGGHR